MEFFDSGGGWFAAAELGAALRFGFRPGLTLHATWTPGVLVVPSAREECLEEDADCEAIRAAALRSFHFGATLKLGGFHFGFTLRALVPSTNRGEASNVVTLTPMLGGSF